MNLQFLLLLFLFCGAQSQPRIPLSEEPSFLITCSPRCGGCQLEDGQKIDCPFLPKEQFSVLRGEYQEKSRTFSIVYVSRVGCFPTGSRFTHYNCPNTPGNRTKPGSLRCTFANSQTQPPDTTETPIVTPDPTNSTSPTPTTQFLYPEATNVPDLEPTSDDKPGSGEGQITTILPSADPTRMVPSENKSGASPLPSESPVLFPTEDSEPNGVVETEVTPVPGTERTDSSTASEGETVSNELQSRVSRLSIKGTIGCRNSYMNQTSARGHIHNCFPGNY